MAVDAIGVPVAERPRVSRQLAAQKLIVTANCEPAGVVSPAGTATYCMSLSSFDKAFSSASIWPPTVKLAGFCRGGKVLKVLRNCPT